MCLWPNQLTTLLKRLILLLLKARYYSEYNIEIMEPEKFGKASIKTGGESMLNKLYSLSAGGGNTFRLLKALYDNCLIQEIRKRVLEVKTTGFGPSLNGRVSFQHLLRQTQVDSVSLFLICFKC